MAADERNLRHLIASDYGKPRAYKAPSGGAKERPIRNRQAHGTRLRRSLHEAIEQASQEAEANLVGLERTAAGIYLIFQGPAGQLPFESLESARHKIEVVNIVTSNGVMTATVFVPLGEEKFFDKKISEYLTQETKKGNPRHAGLVELVEAIAAAPVQALWTDDPRHFPLPGVNIWWEVWIRAEAENEFKRALADFAVEHSQRELRFPDRLVMALHGSVDLLNRLRLVTGAIAEIRRLQETPHFFLKCSAVDQAEWVAELLDRARFPDEGAPAVTILDTGVAREHPLLEPLLSEDDWHAYSPAWPKGDNRLGSSAHGTAMAGLAAYGDLQQALEERGEIALTHRLESVRILPPRGANPREMYGAITQDAVGQAEFASPERQRVYCMAVTTAPCTGQPTSWSASIDSLAAGVLDQQPRLFVISAGNVENSVEPCDDYIDRCETSAAHDPSQAWNGLIVGACTYRQTITAPTYRGWVPLSQPGDLSPYSSTSCSWDPRWPVRPDVVFEGGNLAVSPAGTEWQGIDDLGLLTTHHSPVNRAFDLIHATSAATAQAAHMAAQVVAAERDLWPEAVRALIVHSAEWPDTVLPKFEHAPKRDRGRLLRAYGWGVPSVDRALTSATNDVTILAQDEIVVVKDGKIPEMRFYELPWPKEILEALDDTQVRLKVTLSYFVEPNPGSRGWRGRYRYMSHGLRFHMKRPLESDATFLARINKADRDDEYLGPEEGDDHWFLGSQQRDKGSLHSDVWEGEASNLALRDKLGVVPVGGWWKSHGGERRVRYSLVMSLAAPGVEVDLYNPVAVKLAALANIRAVVAV